MTGISANTSVAPTCRNGSCELVAELLFPCPSLTSVYVAISATSRLGQGPPSNPITIGNNITLTINALINNVN